MRDPKKSKEIFVATQGARTGHELGVQVAAGAIGGVVPGTHHGGSSSDPWVCDPWGWNCWSSCSSSWSWGFWIGWSYPWFWSWYYPCWWWYSRPYYYYDYCYSAPLATVVYSEPQVVYVQGEPAAEGAVQAEPAQQQAAPAPAPENPLSIAAQRYLELGDRAFREGRYTDAVQFYAKAVEFAPDQGALYLVLADALFAAGDYHYGAYALRRALELDAALVESQVDKHGFYPDPSQFDQQLSTLERYLAEHPADRDARLMLAMNYLFGGKPADAARVIQSTQGMTDDPAAQKILARATAAAAGG